MTELPTELKLRLSAVEGWRELGNLEEAWSEYWTIPEKYMDLPEVLEVRWLLEVAAEEWDSSLEIAIKLMELAPERPSGWIHRSYSLRRSKTGGLSAAKSALMGAYKIFPQEPVIPYNLACYDCLLGESASALEWLAMAIKCSSKELIREMTLADEDLRALRPEISRW